MLLATRSDITLETVHRVAWEGEPAEPAPAALARMDECHAAFARLVDAMLAADPGALIYGYTTGPGDKASTRLTPEAEARRPTRLWTAASFGAPLPERIVRAIVLARLANFLDGHAAVRGEVALAVAGMLNPGATLPSVPAEGNGGSGEILALGHLFFGISERFALTPKERMALINGSPCAAALVADAALTGRRRLELAEGVFALLMEVIGAPLEAISEDLEALWEDEHERAALRGLRERLRGGAETRQAFQAPVSFRILPRVVGALRRAQAEAERVAEASLRSVTDNPVFVPPDAARPLGAVFSTGGYHNAAAPAALDGLAHAWADLCQLAQRQTDKLFQHEGTAELLTVDEYMVKPLHMVATGWAEEARRAATTTLISLGGFGQNDTPAMSFLAWEKAARAGRCLDASLAVLATLASQALAEADLPAPPALRPLLDEIRHTFPPVRAPSRVGLGAGALADAFTHRVHAPAAP